MIYTSIACNFDQGILSAALPLFEKERVEGLEWAFDTLFMLENIPEWFEDLLLTYGHQGRLVGHGVFFSVFSARWTPDQKKWLDRLRWLSQKYSFAHVTEHFGFMTGRNFHEGAPMSLPLTASTLAIGRDRLARIQDACNCPVGLENLAFAPSLQAVREHGHFLAELVESVNGFIILDLHNLYCQLHNFELHYEQLIGSYPLELVREIHISGGSWQSAPFNHSFQIRRDTHDDAVPDEVFDLLKKTIPRCPNLQFVVLEQIGNALHAPEQQAQYREDFMKMRRIVKHFERAMTRYGGQEKKAFLPVRKPISEQPVEDMKLYSEQRELASLLENAASYEALADALSASEIYHSAWEIEDWPPDMLETARLIARKWKRDA